MHPVSLFGHPPPSLLAYKIKSKLQNLIFPPFSNRPWTYIFHIPTFSGLIHNQYSNQTLLFPEYDPHVSSSTSLFTTFLLSAMPASSPPVHLFHKYYRTSLMCKALYISRNHTSCRLESSLLKSYDSCKASSYHHCLHELLLGLLARSDHLIIALFTSLNGLSMPDLVIHSSRPL